MFNLSESQSLHIKQVREIAELFGFETKNQYLIIDQDEIEIGRAVELSTHIGHFMMRQIFGHYRRFEILFVDSHTNKVIKATHPFRFIFQELRVTDHKDSPLGVIKQRFSFLYKRFDILGQNNRLLFSVKSPLIKYWTFNISKKNRLHAKIMKKWSGLIDEVFFDRDDFKVQYLSEDLSPRDKNLILVSAIFIDLMYFERKAS